MRLVKKRTKSLNKEQTGKLLDLVEAAVKKDKHFFKLCHDVRRWLAGDHWSGVPKSDQKMARVVVNLMHAHFRTLLPTIFFREPYVEAYPNEPLHHQESAAVWEGLLNHLNERGGYKRATKEIVADAIAYPEGWKKWTYTKSADDEEIETGESDISGESDEAGGSMAEIDDVQPRDEYTLDSAVGVRVSPEQMILDNRHRKIEGSRFIAVRYQKLLSEVVADPRYDFTEKDASTIVKPRRGSSSTPWGLWDDPDSPARSVLNDDDVPVTLYEIWCYQLVDFKLYKQVVVCLKEFRDRPIRGPIGWDEFAGKYLKTYPFNKLELNPIPDAKGVSELQTFRSLQQSVNWLLGRMISMTENLKQFYHFYPNNAKNPTKVMNSRVGTFASSWRPLQKTSRLSRQSSTTVCRPTPISSSRSQ